MNANKQNNIITTKDLLNRGLLTAAEANVKMVCDERFRLITRLTLDVRRALNAAVKNGELGHLKKNGLMPEAYFHPTFKYLAVEARRKRAYESLENLKRVFC